MIANKNKLELFTFPIATGKQNWDYEVISLNIFDNEELVEYYTLEHARKSGANMDNVFYTEDELSENSLLVYRYVLDHENDSINIYNAKRCSLGVVRMLRGKEKGKEFVFSLFSDPSDTEVQLLVYGYLTYGIIDKKLLKKINKVGLTEYLKFIAGKDLYEEIINY